MVPSERITIGMFGVGNIIGAVSSLVGIGGGALKKLNDGGITVYRAVEGTVEDNARLIKSGSLPVYEPSQVCGHHHGVQIGGCVH